jgi:hypothetical protein
MAWVPTTDNQARIYFYNLCVSPYARILIHPVLPLTSLCSSMANSSYDG